MGLSSSAFTTVLNVDERVCPRDLLPFDTDSTTMVCDNSANVHICNKRNMFVGEIKKCTNQGVATIEAPCIASIAHDIAVLENLA